MKRIYIAGAGLFGITIANLLADKYEVHIFESRPHIGGNCYDFTDKETGIRVHKYGPHILHIHDTEILKWIQKFSSFNNYKHQVKACYDGELYDFPINLATINKFFRSNLKPYELRFSNDAQAESCDQTLERRLIRMIGIELYNAFFKDYTIKQWGVHPKNLPAETISRIPIHPSYSTSYYRKRFNGMPADGFTQMFNRMLSSKNITLFLNQHLSREMVGKDDILIYTGSIDKYFDFIFGRLLYRSVIFRLETLDLTDFQGVSVVNYTDSTVPWTRICEPKHFYPENSDIFSSEQTIIIYEYPGAAGEQAYPLRDAESLAIYDQYLELAHKSPHHYFCGRMGAYRYYDMEDCISDAFALAKRIISS